MQSENCSEQVATEWAIDAGHKLSLQLERTWNPEQTVNNIDVINIFVLIENKWKKLAVARKACGRWTGNYDPICSGLKVKPVVVQLTN